jgi:TatA/E family protein of Tat protein translocase
MLHTVAIAWPGPFEMILLAGLGLLIFGKRLPEVGRNIGKGIVEFKRGLKETETELNQEPPAQLPNQSSTTAPKYKFDPYTGKPTEEESKDKEPTQSA